MLKFKKGLAKNAPQIKVNFASYCPSDEVKNFISSYIKYLYQSAQLDESACSGMDTDEFRELKREIYVHFNSLKNEYAEKMKRVKNTIEKKLKDFDVEKVFTPKFAFAAYHSMDKEKMFFDYVRTKAVYADADDVKFNELLDVFVSNFGFLDGTKELLYNWFKIAKQLFADQGNVRGFCLLFISNKNATGKSTIQNCIARAFQEFFHSRVLESSIERITGRFNHVPTTPSVVVFNECFVTKIEGKSALIKDVLGNQPQDVEYKGVNGRVHTLNHNIFIGSANAVQHLYKMEDTRFINIPVTHIKYTVKCHKNYENDIVCILKDIIRYCPDCDGSEFRTIKDKLLPKWNASNGCDQQWKLDLYELVGGDMSNMIKDNESFLAENDTKKSISNFLVGKLTFNDVVPEY